MDLRLRSRVAAITGGNNGLGATSARLLAEERAKLVLAARDGIALDDLAERLRSVSGVVVTGSSITADGGWTRSLA